ncbi:MAG: hypothetical protein HYY43_01530 [Deltaproteobacteria bacterium]|nr:hypothetical protein [Deltaproteobacteria bacterium]MBI2341226.1 hypothetical protein [Deltaproteobacteria bacterium]MBI2974258.1 hypothetical protein [Deltaproteobacteria bacterium]
MTNLYLLVALFNLTDSAVLRAEAGYNKNDVLGSMVKEEEGSFGRFGMDVKFCRFSWKR